MAASPDELAKLRSLESPERRLENAKLKIGYFLKLIERYPFNNEIGDCEDVESAFLWQMEKDYMNVPEHLRYENIKDSLPPHHQERIKRIWESVNEKRKKIASTVKTLKTQWDSADRYTSTPEAVALVATYGEKIPAHYRKALAVMIDGSLHGDDSHPPEDAALTTLDLADEAEMSSIADSWRTSEAGSREKFFKHDKEYITTLRLYYQMLLETNDPESDKPPHQRDPNREIEYVLPKDHSAREEVWLANRYLRLIDAIHQAVAIAKTLHHQQPTGRMREYEDKPYIDHPMATVGRFLKDVMPFVIENRGSKFDFVLMVFILALHDIDEDTSQTIDDIVEKVRSIAEKLDSTIDHDGVIMSGFGHSREYVKEKYIRLLWPGDLEILKQALQVVSKSTPITGEMVTTALNDDTYFSTDVLADFIDPEQLLRAVGGLDKKEKRVAAGRNPKTFRRFAARWVGIPGKSKKMSDDPKLDVVLFKLRTIIEKEIQRRYALLAKMLDRINNMETMDGMWPGSKLKLLRGTTSRLAAYAVVDHNRLNFPLFNVLPDLIEKTLHFYKKFRDEQTGKHRSLYDPTIDDGYIAQLELWKSTTPFTPLPEKWQNVKTQYELERGKRKSPGSIAAAMGDQVDGVLGRDVSG